MTTGKAGAPSRQERRRRILRRDGGTCVWCGRGIDVGLVAASAAPAPTCAASYAGSDG